MNSQDQKQLPPCNQKVYEDGVSIGLFDIPKEVAESICLGISAATGAAVDWHYFGGRVHIKALPATPAPVPDAVEGVVYVVSAEYDHEGGAMIKAFSGEVEAKEFAEKCNAYRSTKKWPDDVSSYTDEWFEAQEAWDEAHPAAPHYLADQYAVQKLPLVSALRDGGGVPEGFVLMPVQCPSWLEDAYDEAVRGLDHPGLFLPGYDAMVEALSKPETTTPQAGVGE